MEIHKIDSMIKKAINESDNHYDSEANNAKERIWHHIQLQKQNQSKPALLRFLAVATVLLFIGLAIMTMSNIRHRKKINALVELNGELKNDTMIKVQNTLKNKSKLAANVTIHDTIFIEKKVIEYKPLVTTKQITDTVYVQQIVYVEKEQKPVLLMMNENNPSSDSVARTKGSDYTSEILIGNKEPLKKDKGKKLQIKFGGNKDQINRGTLTFTTNL